MLPMKMIHRRLDLGPRVVVGSANSLAMAITNMDAEKYASVLVAARSFPPGDIGGLLW